MKISTKFFSSDDCENCFLEVALLISHKDEETSLFSQDRVKCVRKFLSLPFLNENQH